MNKTLDISLPEPPTDTEQTLLRKIFDYSNDAIFIIDPVNDAILEVNPRACRMLGYSRQELRQMPISALHPEEMPALRAFAAAVFQHKTGWTDELSCLTRSGKKLPAEISASVIEFDDRRCLIALVRDISDRHAMRQALQAIVEGTATATGNAFFYSLVRELAAALQVGYAFVTEFLPGNTRVRTLAFWFNGRFIDNFDYDLKGTPCEVVAGGETVYFTSKVYELFPAEPELTEWGIESYFGVPLVAESGEPLGHLAIFHNQPMVKEFRGMALLKIFAARARAELERKRAEQALRQSEERLSGILANATDAIVIIDARQRISLFNTAAEKMFRRPAADIIGQSFEHIFSRRFTHLLKGYFLAVHPTPVNNQQLWAPEGLSGRRGDGEEFPVEATISPLEIGGQKLYTVIMRDLTERKQAEEALNRLQGENRYLQETVKRELNAGEIIGESPAIGAVLEFVGQVASTDTTVLLTGETGTGKGAIARLVHDLSPRKPQLLVTVNCASLPSELVESELFGHEKGAFTGATAQRKGRFELADGGTLFLDEVGELSAGTQAKLLRVLQDHEFERVGGTRSIRVNVRVVAATNRDLAEMVKAGTFRSDLFYRLNVFPIHLPPLRERKTDIPLLARHFLRGFAKRMGKSLRDIAPASQERLMRYPWPGNVRELQNVIERAAILSPGPWLEVDGALNLRLGESPPEALLAGTLEQVERAYVLKVLQENHWVIEGEQGAANILGMKPSTLRSRMQKLGIRKPG
jgi:PAS domain S-box-containing protein